MKDELGGKIMAEFVALRPRTYSYLMDHGWSDKKVKGTKNCVIKRRIKFNDYKEWKSIDAKDYTYIDFGKEVNDNDLKFKVGDHVRISKHKNIFARGYTPNWSEEVFVTKEVKNTVPWTYVINNLNGEKIIGEFYEIELQRTNQQDFRIEKVIKNKGDKLYVKWKRYDSSFNSWIDKKDLV